MRRISTRMPRNVEPPVHLGEAECLRTTEKAILVRLETGKEVWIPNSQVHDDSEVFALRHKGRLLITAWWARKEKLGEYADPEPEEPQDAADGPEGGWW